MEDMKAVGYELELAIDENRLDEEWINQPVKYFRAASALADARRELDESKAILDVTKAEADKKIRASPGSFGIAKITEKVVESTVIQFKEFKEAQEDVLSAKHSVDILQAAVAAMDHRKAALQKLVELFLASYYAKPNAPAGERDRVDEMEKRAIRQRGRKKR